MPAAAIDVPAPPLVPGAHRVIRVIESEEGPFAGVLVTRGDAVAVRVDAAALAGWDGWHFGGSEHVVGPLDIVRRAKGHDVLLPWCTQRVSTFVGRRTAAGEGLSPGECGTLLVSLFRALGELGRADAVVGTTGAWWLTDDGRPVSVGGAGDAARRGVAELVAQLGGSCDDKTLGRLLRVVEEGLRTNLEQHRRVPQLLLEKWEREVLDVAAPRALRREQVASDVAPGAVNTAPRREFPSTRSPARRDTRAPASRFAVLAVRTVTRVVEHVGVLRARRARRRAASGRSALRPRRPLLVAAGAAAAVLLIGLLWPSGATSEVVDGADGPAEVSQASDPKGGSAADRSSAAASRGGTAGATPAARPSPSAAVSRPAADDPAGAASWLLREIAMCADTGDAVCAEAVADGSSDVIAALVGDGSDVGDGGDAGAAGGADSSSVELIDEYGDAAVVRFTPREKGSADTSGEAEPGEGQILVLVRINEIWLVRDVYDVADQPE
jgi:hypothetical protein